MLVGTIAVCIVSGKMSTEVMSCSHYITVRVKAPSIFTGKICELCIPVMELQKSRETFTVHLLKIYAHNESIFIIFLFTDNILM